MRKLILVALASGTFGGAVGALATAATESQANAQAVAAAVQKVQDKSAESALAAIRRDLSFGHSSAAYDLYEICENTRSSNPALVTC